MENFSSVYGLTKEDIVLWNNVVGVGTKVFNFQIPNYYQIKGAIGQGSYGVVMSALDMRNNSRVAIKKIVNLFEQNEFFQKRILREVKIMKHYSLTNAPNLLPLLDLVLPQSFDSFRDCYIVTPLMEFDLSRITNVSKPATERMAKYLIFQILEGLVSVDLFFLFFLLILFF